MERKNRSNRNFLIAEVTFTSIYFHRSQFLNRSRIGEESESESETERSQYDRQVMVNYSTSVRKNV